MPSHRSVTSAGHCEIKEGHAAEQAVKGPVARLLDSSTKQQCTTWTKSCGVWLAGARRCVPGAHQLLFAGGVCGHRVAAAGHGPGDDGLCGAGLPVPGQPRRPHDRHAPAVCLHGHCGRLLLGPPLQALQGRAQLRQTVTATQQGSLCATESSVEAMHGVCYKHLSSFGQQAPSACLSGSKRAVPECVSAELGCSLPLLHLASC